MTNIKYNKLKQIRRYEEISKKLFQVENKKQLITDLFFVLLVLVDILLISLMLEDYVRPVLIPLACLVIIRYFELSGKL